MKSSNKSFDFYDQMVLIGVIISAHGLRGTVKVRYFSESPLLYNSLSRLFVEVPGISKLVALGVVWVKPYKRWVYLRLEGKNNRIEADSIVGSKIYTKKAELPRLEEDTYFWTDLIGMSVESIDGTILGTIVSIIPTGSNDVYVVKSTKKDTRSEILIPAIKSVVVDVRLAACCMIVDLPEGI